jgi:hypothetical protein
LIGIYPDDYLFAKPFRNTIRIIVLPQRFMSCTG